MSVETIENTQHIVKSGYRAARGLGGTVTQLTDRTTAVTLNALTGTITTNNASLAGEAAAEFTVNNNLIEVGDVVVACIAGGSNSGNTLVQVSAVAKGSFKLLVCNNNASVGVAESGAIAINFIVFKGQTN